MAKYIKETTSTHKKQSDYIGVTWNTQNQKWTSCVNENGIRYECGYYDNERDAAKGRDMKILRLGLKAKLQILTKL